MAVLVTNKTGGLGFGPISNQKGLAAAMVVIAGDEEQGPVDCPVVKEWLQLEAVVARGAKGKVSICQTDHCDRNTVADNYELLLPILTNFGNYPALTIFCSKDSFMTCGLGRCAKACAPALLSWRMSWGGFSS